MDNCAQFLIQIINDHKTELFPLNDIRNTINQLNMMVGGVSKYLLYILKLFKAYSVDFVTENNILAIDEEFNYQLNIDQMHFEANMRFPLRWNMSQYEWVNREVPDWNEFNFGLHDGQYTSDGVYMETMFGDVKISD